MRAINFTGERFGRLLTTERVRLGNRLAYVCTCDCGERICVVGHRLRSGQTKSCGCLKDDVQRARLIQHGHYNSPTYKSWSGMIQRCTNQKNLRYRDYGGRGITVCERWRNFKKFLEDMGERPAGLTLDRIDNDKGYFLDNCKWATYFEQCHNRRPYVRHK